MKIKVCGMRDSGNIGELVKLKPDYIGFIFYQKSKRYVGEQIPDKINRLIPASIQKVGIFVDEPFDTLHEKFRNNQLDLVQLHGNELPDYCERLRALNIPVIKAFSVAADFDFETTVPYHPFCNYFLFDTAGDLRGGNGIKFNWEKLDQYMGRKPFFLCGGIQPDDLDEIKKLSHSQLHAVDVNSGFEIEPGVKDISKLRLFLDELRK